MKNLRLPTYLTSLLLGFVLVLATPLYAQERDLSRATPSSVGLSEAGVQDLADGMRKAVDDGNLAGIVSTLMRNGKVVHMDAYGYQDIENAVPTT